MQYPTVTEVLAPYSDFSHIPPDVLQAAASRGTAVHEACAAIAQDLFPVVTDETAGYVESFRRWYGLMVQSVELAEERIVDTDLGFSGQIDLLCFIEGMLTLIDIKTPIAKSPSWRLQLASYWHLCGIVGPHPLKVGSLRLSPEGKMARIDWYSGTILEDFNLFLQALNVYRFYNP